MPEGNRKAKRKGKYWEQSLPPTWHWKEDQEISFRTLKEQLTTYPILGYPDFTKPFELHTDASGTSLGAVLYQTQNNNKRVIAYASRGL